MDLMPRGYGFDSFFDSFVPERKNSHCNMKCDIYEKDGEYNLEIDVPGFNKEDVEIEFENGYLTVTAIKDDINDDKNYIRRERRYGRYQRSFYVGNINQDSIQAEFLDGSLKIKFPMEEEKPNKKLIEIK